jgi:predicted membrane-bound spermidine synthase
VGVAPSETCSGPKGDYFQLLKFAEKHYDSIVVDLPEIINDATAEVISDPLWGTLAARVKVRRTIKIL